MDWRAIWQRLRRFYVRPQLALPAPEPRIFDVGAESLVYAIGDIHGRLDLFDKLLGKITADASRRQGAGAMHLILLGDLVDRGPDSAGVIKRAIQLSRLVPNFVCLMGNHEEVFVDALSGHEAALRLFVRIGGREALMSYGIAEEVIDGEDQGALYTAMLTQIPEQHRDFLRDMSHVATVGDYVFVHAGIRPGVPMIEQRQEDLHWIRREFLEHEADHGFMVVHGHTIEDEPVMGTNRIGIDTGAYRTGRLTALGLQGTERWVLST